MTEQFQDCSSSSLKGEILARVPEMAELRPPTPLCAELGETPGRAECHRRGHTECQRCPHAGWCRLCQALLTDQTHIMGRNGDGQAQQVLHRMVAAGANSSSVCGCIHRWRSRSMAQPRAGDAAVMRVPRGSPAAVAGPGPVKRRSREEALPPAAPCPGPRPLGPFAPGCSTG
ncbi:uncharacterized protein ACIQIH_013883 [Cyanocitta cristata]